MSKQRYSTNAERQQAYRARKAGTVTPTVTQFRQEVLRMGLSLDLAYRLGNLAATCGIEVAREAAAIAVQAVKDEQAWAFLRVYDQKGK